MKLKVEVRAQAELDSVIAAGNIAICVGDGWFTVSGSAHVEARGSSHVVARESSHVVAWGSSHVEARANAFVRVFSALKIRAAASVVLTLHGKCNDLEGGHHVRAIVPGTAQEWCDFYGVAVQDEIATVYKAVNDKFRSPHGMTYEPGSIPRAIDWDGGHHECGGGLHFSPTPAAAREFNSDGTRYVACPVALSAMRAPRSDDSYPQKIKAECCCGPVYEVDIMGNVVTTEKAA